jgi:TRAP-type C4-dicarboxylate transport system permease small subunit
MQKVLLILAQISIDPNDVGIPQVPADQTTIARILTLVFTAIGAMAVLFMILGGVRYVISNGNQNEIQKAKDMIMYAAIGVVGSTLSFVIVQFVLGRILR